LHVDRRGDRAPADGDGHPRDRDGRPCPCRVRGQHLVPEGRARELERAVRRTRRPHRARGRTRAGDGGRGPRGPPPAGGRLRARPAPGPPESPELSRGLNLWDTSLLVLGLVIGGGIFLTPTSIAKAVPSEPWILAAWIVGGLLAVAGGLVFA